MKYNEFLHVWTDGLMEGKSLRDDSERAGRSQVIQGLEVQAKEFTQEILSEKNYNPGKYYSVFERRFCYLP